MAKKSGKGKKRDTSWVDKYHNDARRQLSGGSGGSNRSSKSGLPPGSTRYNGQPHSSKGTPAWHVDKDVTDLDGNTVKEHSTDPGDIAFGEKVGEAIREGRRKRRPR